MTATTTAGRAAGQTERVLFGKLWWVGPLAVVAAVVANLAATALFQAVLRPDPAFLPLTFPPVAIFTIFFGALAVAVYAAVGRLSRRPVSLYRRIALVALVVSCIPDLLIPFQPAAFPGGSWPSAIALIVLHIIGWAVIVPLLTRLAGEE